MKLQCKVLTYALGLTLILAAGAGCKSKGDIEVETFEPIDTGMDSDKGESTNYGDGLNTGLDMDSLVFQAFDDPSSPNYLHPVYFDYDSYSLRPDALQVLSTNADVIRKLPNVIIQIAGHCDERGTSEYNFALGERRALAVRTHLMNLGVSGDRIVTISYGEESPAVMGSGEAVWSQNRRCAFARAQAL